MNFHEHQRIYDALTRKVTRYWPCSKIHTLILYGRRSRHSNQYRFLALLYILIDNSVPPNASTILEKRCCTHVLKFPSVHGKKLGHCNRLLKTGCNNVVGATLFLVVNDIVQHCYTWLRVDLGSTILFNVVNNQEQCCPNNIVASCFQQDLIFSRVEHHVFLRVADHFQILIIIHVFRNCCFHSQWKRKHLHGGTK